MAKEFPKISVIVPIYNTGKYLAPALSSIAAQTFTDFECILINDGSTDESGKVAREFAAGDSRFIVIEKENGGVSSARNAGLEAARGEWITFMDHDDLMAPDCLWSRLSVGEKYGVDMVRGEFAYFEGDVELAPPNLEDFNVHISDNGIDGLIEFTRLDEKSTSYGWWALVWCCLFRRSVIADRRFDVKLRAGGEDIVFMLDALSGAVKKVACINKVGNFYRRSEVSTLLGGRLHKSVVEAHPAIVSAVVRYSRAHPGPTGQYVFAVALNDIVLQDAKKSVRRGQHTELMSSVLREILTMDDGFFITDFPEASRPLITALAAVPMLTRAGT